MSDETETETPPAVVEAATTRLNNRMARLTKLIELRAPMHVVAREVLNIEDALWLGWPDAMTSALESRNVERVRKQARLCVMPTCGNPSEQDKEMCASCQADFEREYAETDGTPEA